MSLDSARAELIDVGARLAAAGLVIGTAGNLSIRVGDVVAVTPSGMAWDRLEPPSVCVVDLGGAVVEASVAPSTELPMHLAIYRGTDAGAVVHTHSPYATALSTVVDELPPIHYAIAELGGRVRVAPYRTFGTAELAAEMIAALVGRAAVILQNHGSVTYGSTVAQAYDRAVTLEWLSATYGRARVLGQPNLLADEEIERVRQRFVTLGYGKR